MASAGGASPELLHADEEQLDRAALLLRDGSAFVIVAGPKELQPAALGLLRRRMRGMEIPDPAEVGTPDEMLGALVDHAREQRCALSLVVGRDAAGALRALNLHREKLLRGAPVILWVDGGEALQRVREEAPDAYAFRSTTVVLRGEGDPVPAPGPKEPEPVTRLRRRFERARSPVERAGASLALSAALRSGGKLREAEGVALAGLDGIAQRREGDEALEMRARLAATLAATALRAKDRVQQLRWARRALDDVAQMSPARGAGLRALALAVYPGPFYGRDRTATEEALVLARAHAITPELRSEVLRAAVTVARYTGDLRRARALLGETSAISAELGRYDRALVVGQAAYVDAAAGSFQSAEAKLREAVALLVESGGAYSPVPEFVLDSIRQGELDHAERLLRDHEREVAEAYGRFTLLLEMSIVLARGDAAPAIAAVRALLTGDANDMTDGSYFDACAVLTSMTTSAHEAGRLAPDELAGARADLEVAERALLRFSGREGPAFYPVQLLHLRARLFALTPAAARRALDLARRALDLARGTYPDLIAASGRVLADVLLRARRSEEALDLVAGVEPEAEQRGCLRELARLRADRLLALVQRGDAGAAIEPHARAFRDVLAAGDAPRITAEILRDLALRLPPQATAPDPLALAEEAHGLFVAMPMPAEEARCLEIAGDVLRARGRGVEARNRYVLARARLARYGLGLRRPLLDDKISSFG